MSHERKESPSSSALTIDVDTARRQFYQLLELLPCAAYTCDHKGLITFFNRLAKELWGREPALNHPSELYCGSYRLFEKSGALIPRQDGVVARVLRENNSSAAGEFVIQQLEGKKIDVLVQATAMHNDAGEPIGVVVLLTSLSARNVSEQLLGDVLEATSPKVGQDYIHAVANQLCRSCQVKYAMIGELDTNTSDMIHALAVSMDGEPMKEFSYSLTDTPCSVVIEGDICYYPERVQDLFRGS